MIELFSRNALHLKEEFVLTPVYIDDSVSSLSAILLNDAYYQVLIQGRNVIDGLSVLRPEYIIPFKAKAWLDLRNRTDEDHSNIKKHRNDIIRLVSELEINRCALPNEVTKDMEEFINAFSVTEAELKSLRIRGVSPQDVKEALIDIYIHP